MTRNYIYYASSPYQHLLCLSLAAQTPKNVNTHLISAANFTKSDSFLQSLLNWEDSPIDAIYLYESPIPHSQPKYTILQCKQVIKSRQIAKSLSPSRVYVGKDTEAAPQALMHYSPQATKIGIEDGSSVYSSVKSNNTHVFHYLALKILYGYWFDRPTIIGGSNFLDSFAAIFPNEIRIELEGLNKIAIKNDFLRSMDLGWLEPFFTACEFEIQDCQDLDTLVIAAHSNLVSEHPEYSKLIKKEIEKKDNNNKKVGIKYHPREYNPNYLNLDEKNIKVISNSVPAEIIYLSSENLTTIIGSASTSLLTARWLNSSLSVVSMAKATGIGDNSLIETMQTVGIQFR